MLENSKEEAKQPAEASVEKNEEKKSTKKSVAESTEDTSEDAVTKADPSSGNEAVDAVEEEVAKNAENSNDEDEEDAVNYDELALEELVAILEKAVKEEPVQKIKGKTDAIKSAFNQKFGALLAEKKAQFLAEGGESIDFQFTSPLKSTYNALLSEYKKKRDAYYADLDAQLKINLEKRNLVIEQLKNLIDEADTKTMYKQFRELQSAWRSIGPVPKTKYNDTWKIYHHHVERFYDLLHLSNDFRDLDFKNNLEQKLALIEKAEALVDVEDVNLAFKELQGLHKEWKEDIGPVAKELREEVWQKFSDVTKKIHDKRHDYYKSLKSQVHDIVEKKMEVIEKIKNYDTSKNKTHKDWQKSIKDIEAYRKQFFDAGKLPFAKSEEVWQKFKNATKQFNHEKNAFYKSEKSGQQDNLKKKKALIELAESLKDSEDWDMATEKFKRIQADWKKIGHVPRKFSDDIWKQFKAACNHYFDRYHNQKNALTKEQMALVEEKKAYLEGLSFSKKPTKEEVLEVMQKWTTFGTPLKSAKNLDTKFNKLIEKQLELLNLSEEEISLLKFKNIVNGYVASENIRKLDAEQNFVRKKIDESVREIQQLENNLSFISSSSEDNPLVQNVLDQVEQYKKDLEVWQQKLDYLKTLNY